jgi:hypothetical protein
MHTLSLDHVLSLRYPCSMCATMCTVLTVISSTVGASAENEAAEHVLACGMVLPSACFLFIALVTHSFNVLGVFQMSLLVVTCGHESAS